MSKSPIEWTEHTWNPIVGCSIVSPGCTNCYAMKMAARIEAMGNQPRYAGTTRKVNGNAIWTGKLACAPDDAFLAPLRRKKPTIYFVNSMGDLFHEDAPDEWIDRVFAVMALCPQHTFQILTKRAKRMKEYLSTSAQTFAGAERRDDIAAVSFDLNEDLSAGRKENLFTENDILLNGNRWPLPNVWLGVSTERQQEADERIPLLLRTLAAVRFISAEPLLGPIDLTAIEAPEKVEGERWTFDALTTGDYYTQHGEPGFTTSCGDGPYREHALDWVVVGGESGSGSRPMHPDWARSLRDQCAAAGVSFFFKQWGANVPFVTGEPNGHWIWKRVGKKKAGRFLDGKEHNGFPAIAEKARAA